MVMIRLIKKMVKVYKSYTLYRRCKRAIREANRAAIMTRKVHVVIMLNGRPVVISKQGLRKVIRDRAKGSGFTIQHAEKLCIYKTRRPCS
jgi:hypothetical protein